MACIGRELEREALALGVPRRRVHFLPNAIDMAAFRPPAAGERADLRRSLGLPAAGVVCVFLGRLSLEKGLMDLMAAWRVLQRPGATLLVVGPDMDGHAWNVGPSARSFAHEHGLEGSVRFLGSTRNPAPLLRAADIFIQPSHFEAQGLSAVEALACGVPVVASATGGLLDFVKDNENGKLFPPKDSVALAAALQLLIDDDTLRARMAFAARPSVETEYTTNRSSSIDLPHLSARWREPSHDARRPEAPLPVSRQQLLRDGDGGKRGAHARAPCVRRPPAVGRRLRPLPVRAGTDDDHRNNHGHRARPSHDARRGARQGRSGSSVSRCPRAQVDVGGAWPRHSRRHLAAAANQIQSSFTFAT